MAQGDWTESNRAVRKWTRREQALRIAWALVWPVFRFSPRPLWGFRRLMLRLFGAQVAAGAHVYPTARITMPWHLSLGHNCAVGDSVILYALGPIVVGDRATVSQYAHLCAGTHDLSDPTRPLLKLPIVIGDDVWIAADAFVGPGVSVAPGAVVGARAVVVRDVEAGAVVVGNPARVVRRIPT